MGIANNNVRRYLEYLEDAYLINLVPQYSYSVKKQIYNPDKVFVVDTGLASMAGFSFSQNQGRLLENVVYYKLLSPDREVYYWKNSTELDFLIRKGVTTSQLINVTQTVDDDGVLNRELNSLAVAEKEFPKAQSQLLTLHNESGVKDDKVKSLFNFLLTEEQ